MEEISESEDTLVEKDGEDISEGYNTKQKSYEDIYGVKIPEEIRQEMKNRLEEYESKRRVREELFISKIPEGIKKEMINRLEQYDGKQKAREEFFTENIPEEIKRELEICNRIKFYEEKRKSFAERIISPKTSNAEVDKNTYKAVTDDKEVEREDEEKVKDKAYKDLLAKTFPEGIQLKSVRLEEYLPTRKDQRLLISNIFKPVTQERIAGLQKEYQTKRNAHEELLAAQIPDILKQEMMNDTIEIDSYSSTTYPTFTRSCPFSTHTLSTDEVNEHRYMNGYNTTITENDSNSDTSTIFDIDDIEEDKQVDRLSTLIQYPERFLYYNLF